MENASKALLIAGGILIAIIIVSVFMLMYNELTSIPKTQEEIKTAEQLAEFNKKYESYNKKKMYGTDVVTVTNMAINNNNKYSYDPDYKITIEVNLTNKIEAEGIQYYFDPSTMNVKEGTRENLKNIISGCYDLTEKYNNNEWKEILNLSKLDKSTSEYVYAEKKGLKDYETTKEKKWVEVYYNSKKYDGYYMTTNLSYAFRNKKFKCTGISYRTNGRVEKLSFEEI